jgi:hypothetical protein
MLADTPTVRGEGMHVPADLGAVLAELRAIRSRLEAIEGGRPEWLDSRQAAQHTSLSLRTLLRADADGEEVGLRRCGNKLAFNRGLLDTWLLSKTAK